jgi:hypothetical protein
MKLEYIFLMVFSILFLIIPIIANAHIPELVLEDRNYSTNPIIVEDPEISYAYYGKLQGSPQIYKIQSDRPFRLYVSLLVPYVGQEETSDVEFHIMKDGKKIVMMHDYQNWTKWYEEYAGDWYLQGPEYEADVEAGVYLVEVHSDTNSEDYTLAIGDVERFGPMEILNTIFILPIMKAFFWNDYAMLLIYLALVVLLVAILYLAMKHFRKKRK